MSSNDVPTHVAHDLVELLFDNGTPASTESLLLVNPTATIGTSLKEFYESEYTASAPTTTVIHRSEESTQEFDWESFCETNIQTHFLTPHVEFGGEFDYILCLPEDIKSNELSEEEQKELATNFASLSVDSATINPTLLHVEQTLKYLNVEGRGTLLTGPEFQHGDANQFGNEIYYSIDHIDAYDPNEEPSLTESRAAALITHTETEAEHTGFSYNPEEFESLLGNSVDAERPFEVAAVMTKDPLGFGVDEPASETYFDLHYRDFDAALVFEDPENRVGLQGYVSRQQLKSGEGAALSGRIEALDDGILLSPDAGMDSLIESLGTHRFQFVGAPENVEGVVTRFDLNRLPVFLHLFDRFSEFEIGLRNLIREELPDWEEQTSVYVHSQRDDELYHDKLAMASLSNLIDIVDEGDLDTEIRRDIRGYDVTLEDLESLRNKVAHYNPIIHTMGGSSEHSDERDAPQLRSEYRLLSDSIAGLQTE